MVCPGAQETAVQSLDPVPVKTLPQAFKVQVVELGLVLVTGCARAKGSVSVRAVAMMVVFILFSVLVDPWRIEVGLVGDCYDERNLIDIETDYSLFVLLMKSGK
jgi:hypothetical protein